MKTKSRKLQSESAKLQVETTVSSVVTFGAESHCLQSAIIERFFKNKTAPTLKILIYLLYKFEICDKMIMN